MNDIKNEIVLLDNIDNECEELARKVIGFSLDEPDIPDEYMTEITSEIRDKVIGVLEGYGCQFPIVSTEY